MSTSFNTPGLARRPATGWFWFVLLGIVQILMGAWAWFDAGLATVAGVVLIGAALLVGGVVQVLHAFLDRSWSAFLLHLFSGVLYAIAGVLIIFEPLQGALVLTILIAVALIVGGIFRVVISVSHWHMGGAGLLLIGGLISMGVGIGLYLLLPWSGLWVLGTLIAVELIVHGAAWVEFGLALRRLRHA